MSSIIWLRTICQKNGLKLTDAQSELMESYVRLLLQLNRHLNLISRKDEENIWQNHILHSISPLFKLHFADGLRILDLGTGGGLPGIPLKIFLTSLDFTLLDSVQKKTKAVEEIIRTLGLSGISVICSRAEDLSRKSEFKHYFDVVISRSVALLKDLVIWSAPLLKPNLQQMKNAKTSRQEISAGILVAFKGGNLKREIEQARTHAKAKSFEEIPLVFNGSESLTLADKKIVLVRF